jgi:COP9 signalosome complex subunit 4
LASVEQCSDKLLCCLQELGTLLDVDPVKAEDLAADMIGEGRLQGSIDQVEGLIHFEDSLEQLVQWDRQVAATCVKVDNILEQVVAANGAAVAAQ